MAKYFSSTISDTGAKSNSISINLDDSKKKSKWTLNNVKSSWNFSVVWVFWSILICFVMIPFVVQWINYGEIRNLTNIRMLFNDLTTFNISKQVWEYDLSKFFNFNNDVVLDSIGGSIDESGGGGGLFSIDWTSVFSFFRPVLRFVNFIFDLLKLVIGLVASIIEFVMNVLVVISRLVSGYYNTYGYEIDSYWRDTSLILNSSLI